MCLKAILSRKRYYQNTKSSFRSRILNVKTDFLGLGRPPSFHKRKQRIVLVCIRASLEGVYNFYQKVGNSSD